MRQYKEPWLEVIRFETNDVITTSGIDASDDNIEGLPDNWLNVWGEE